jgi:hypothetical protein
MVKMAAKSSLVILFALVIHTAPTVHVRMWSRLPISRGYPLTPYILGLYWPTHIVPDLLEQSQGLPN